MTECPVCGEEIKKPVMSMGCKHVFFCRKCIDAHLRKVDRCPVCNVTTLVSKLRNLSVSDDVAKIQKKNPPHRQKWSK